MPGVPSLVGGGVRPLGRVPSSPSSGLFSTYLQVVGCSLTGCAPSSGPRRHPSLLLCPGCPRFLKLFSRNSELSCWGLLFLGCSGGDAQPAHCKGTEVVHVHLALLVTWMASVSSSISWRSNKVFKGFDFELAASELVALWTWCCRW